MNLAHHIGLLHAAEADLAAAFRDVADAHPDEPDVRLDCQRLATWCDRHVAELAPFAERYGEAGDDEPDRIRSAAFGGSRSGPLGLLRDLQDLYLMASECDITWTLVGQAAKGARDDDLLAAVERCEGETATQQSWLRTRLKQAAPQALVVA
ncbi:MAG TPA: hypothetical protein VF743_03530 [Acidimicrobiales bacterium]